MTSESAAQIRNILDVVNESSRALKQLGRPTSHWDDWFVFHITENLDSKTVKDWEISRDEPDTVPTYDDLMKFLKSRAQGLEAAASITKVKTPTTKTTAGSTKPQAAGSVHSHSTAVGQCVCCSDKHALPACTSFRQRAAADKLTLVRNNNICENCLKNFHSISSCTSKFTCKRCQAKHHTLLHDAFEVPTNAVTTNHHRTNPEQVGVESKIRSLPKVLLATALIKAHSSSGHTQQLRALLDPGSEATFISEFAAQQLRLPRTRVALPVIGVGNASVGTAKALAEFTFSSLLEPDFTIACLALVFPSLGRPYPATNIETSTVSEFRSLTLADPTFTVPSGIDVIIGADIYGSLLYSEIIRPKDNALVAQNTHLGWIVCGPASSNNIQQLRTTFCATTALELNNLVQQMWTFNQHADLASSSTMTMDELYCEEYFERTSRRDEAGRFIVRYPFKSSANLSALTESKQDALRLFDLQQRRLKRDPNMQALYEQFMAQHFISLGHMQPVLDTDPTTTFCYIPHHGVYKESSSTTKLQTVFNASRRLNSGVSLNDCLHTGPKLQNDLADLLMSWRLHRIGFIADIVKCFRQIRVHDEDADMQRIFWHHYEGKPQSFRLLTVTYGLNCSPYLTIKVLRTLAKEEEEDFPRASKILQEAFYMDDCLHGADSVSEALLIKTELQALLQHGGFPFRKWNSNSTEFLQKIGNDAENSIDAYCDLTLSRAAKALGIYWACSTDTIGYKITLSPCDGPIPKRQQLSDVAKTFDPLGLLAPVIIIGKIMFQELWTIGCRWDDPIPEPYQRKWLKFREELPVLEKLKINHSVYTSAEWSGPRWLSLREQDWPIQPVIPGAAEAVPVTTLVTAVTDTMRDDMLRKYSNINQLLAVTVWCRTFLAATRNIPHSTEPWCTAGERASALQFWIRYVQNLHFSDEILRLREGKTISPKSKLRKLNPELDTDGILRLKGRLKNAFLPEAECFPIILPKEGPLTTLIIANAHECTLHGGTQSTLNFIRRRYWLIDGRAATKKFIRRCIKCFRQRCQPAQQIMGVLPAARCTPSKPFSHCGIDYGGPYRVRTSKGRGHQAHKAYVALFVCFSTRAIHIELVSDMTTATFLYALRRFFAVRGYSSDMYSDCATTFVGASAVLRQDAKDYRKQLEAGARYSAVKGITWHFIPPGSPNFGGIWEAGIKSMKHHLKRVVGEATLTFEEFYTVLKEVEAVLNSRPLAAMSDDPDDLSALTPAHILTGGPLIAPSEPSLRDTKSSSLTRCKQVQQMHQHFWQRWSSDYLKGLQVRHKWQQAQAELKIGDLVLLRDERAPPSQWQLGRVLEVHPGDDDRVRVATVRTKTTTLKRAISKLVVLPLEQP